MNFGIISRGSFSISTLSEKMDIYANTILKSNGIKYKTIQENTAEGE